MTAGSYETMHGLLSVALRSVQGAVRNASHVRYGCASASSAHRTSNVSIHRENNFLPNSKRHRIRPCIPKTIKVLPGSGPVSSCGPAYSNHKQAPSLAFLTALRVRIVTWMIYARTSHYRERQVTRQTQLGMSTWRKKVFPSIYGCESPDRSVLTGTASLRTSKPWKATIEFTPTISAVSHQNTVTL